MIAFSDHGMRVGNDYQAPIPDFLTCSGKYGSSGGIVKSGLFCLENYNRLNVTLKKAPTTFKRSF